MKRKLKGDPLIISCFAGIGKNYAINFFREKGYLVDSIEKEKDFYGKYKTSESYIKDVKSRARENDILFIPYWLGMENKFLSGKLKYILIYPDRSLKYIYIARFRNLGFTPEQIDYLKNNFDKMIDDCDTCDVPGNYKFKLDRNQYCSDVICWLLEQRGEKIITEGVILDSKDIFWNKQKFEDGETNLCLITGQSGSGKSTLAHSLEDDITEVYELDDVIWNKECYTMENFKEYGDLIYSFFNGPGKKYYLSDLEVKENYGKTYTNDLMRDFISYAVNYADTHKSKKYVLEGVWFWILNDDFFKPEDYKEYAVYILGTSSLKSAIRAVKRDSKDYKPKDKVKYIIKDFTNRIKNISFDEKLLKKWRVYYTKLIENN